MTRHSGPAKPGHMAVFLARGRWDEEQRDGGVDRTRDIPGSLGLQHEPGVPEPSLNSLL